MKYRRICTAFLSAAGIFLLIIDGQTAIEGAAEGIDLCIRSVIPALFPFFVLGSLLTATLLGSNVPLLRYLGKQFCVPTGAESLVLIGFLGGYPVGTQTLAQAYRSGQLDKKSAERMLAFCNQPGPSFLFGILGTIFSPGKACLLWAIQICSAFLVSCCIPVSEEVSGIRGQEPITLAAAVMQGIRTMAAVCGWVILFRIGIAFVNRWFLWILPDSLQVGIMGLLELANGCLALNRISDPSIRFLICSGMLGFGGICVTMQTASVAQGLSLRLYFPGKILQAGFSMLICWVISPIHKEIPLILIPLILICIFSLRKMEKRSGNPMLIGV